MTVMRRVKADGKASVPKPDTTVSGPKDSSRPGSSVGSQPKVKNSSKKHLRKQKLSKRKSSKSSWWTQQDSYELRELVLTSLILLSLAGFFAFDVPGMFYSAMCNQKQSDPARAYPGPISLTIDQPGTYTWSAAIEQPGTYIWSDGVLTTYSTQFATRIVDCCRTVRPS